ncbi:MAG: hypothetical protein Q8R65_08330 [Polynucleobacter sp.]|nr:hypothetical protein [Polynucleobacter sp.]
MKTSPLQEAYFRFVRLLTTLESSSAFPELDDIERSLLNTIALRSLEGKPILVGDIIFLNKAGSPATLHRRLSKLLKADLIRHGSDIDGRKKYLELTPRAQDYFAKLGECIQKAAG